MFKEEEFFKVVEVFINEFKDEIAKERDDYMIGKPKYESEEIKVFRLTNLQKIRKEKEEYLKKKGMYK